MRPPRVRKILDLKPSPSIVPSLAIMASAVLWGTLWIPLRELRDSGLSGAAATAVGYLLPLLLLLPLALPRLRPILASGWPAVAAGFLMALTIALYSEGMVRGQVARVILLFYLTPVWTTLMTRFLLGEAITGRRVLTILLGLAGMLVIFGFEQGFPLPRHISEWMGLIAGAAWGLAMVCLQRKTASPMLAPLFMQFIFLGPIFLLCTQIPGARGGDSLVFELAALLENLPWLLAIALVWMLPVIWLTIYGGTKIDPGKVVIFLMLEIVVGLGTAALLTDEPFGAREVIGAILIMSASLVEAVAPARKAREPASG